MTTKNSHIYSYFKAANIIKMNSKNCFVDFIINTPQNSFRQYYNCTAYIFMCNYDLQT